MVGQVECCYGVGGKVQNVGLIGIDILIIGVILDYLLGGLCIGDGQGFVVGVVEICEG